MYARAARDCAPAPRRGDEPAPTKQRRLAPELVASADGAAQYSPDSPPLWIRMHDTNGGRTSPVEGPLAPRQGSSSASPLLFSPYAVSDDDAMCVEMETEGSPQGPEQTDIPVDSPTTPARRRSPDAVQGPCRLCLQPHPSPARTFGGLQRATRDFERPGGVAMDSWDALAALQTEIYAHCHKLGAQVAKADVSGEWSNCPLKAAERRWQALQACLARLEAIVDALHWEAHSGDPLRDARLPLFRERYRHYTDYAAQLRVHLLHHVLPAVGTELEQRTVFCELFGPERGRTAFAEWRDTMQLRGVVANCAAALTSLDGQLRAYRL